MKVLIRRISPYDGPDVLLGVFRSAREWIAARAKYLEGLVSRRREDPWRKQTYKDVGCAERAIVGEVLSDMPNHQPSLNVKKAHASGPSEH